MRFFCGLVIAAAFVSFGTGCSRSSYPSVSSISENWLEIKTALGSADVGSAGSNPRNIETRLDYFHGTLNRFFASPLGSLYLIHNPVEVQSLETIASDVQKLKTAVNNSDGKGIFLLIPEIDKNIDLLRQVDAKLSDRSQLHYFMLFFFFSLLILIIILTMRMFYSRLEKAEKRELQSLAFSRETVMVQEQERERIARELHDTALQDLWRLSFQTDSINKTDDPLERNRLCAEVVRGQKEVMGRIRAICDSLIPQDFQRRHLDDALRSLCYSFRQRTGVECSISVQEDLRLEKIDSSRQLQVFRIVQECLTNIEKHSGATEASVLMRFQGKNLLINVSDNGRGLPPGLLPGFSRGSASPDRDSCATLRADGHFGLWNMYGRAALLAGTLSLDSEAGTGTMVTLSVPWEAQE